MSAYEGSKMQERDENRKNIKKEVVKAMTDKLLEMTEPAFKSQNEKLREVYIIAKAYDFDTWLLWMEEHKYFIGKI